MTTPWSLKSAHTVGDRCDIVFTRTTPDAEGDPAEETHTVKHFRTSFGGSKQTLVQWKANIKREVAGLVALLNAADHVQGTMGQTGSERMYRVTVGPQLSVRLEGPDGEDFDLYVKRGAPPTLEDYDRRGYTNSANEAVSLDVSEAGDYYIMVRSYRGSGDYRLWVAME